LADRAAGPAQRIDRLLWYLRFAKSRSRAQAMAEAGLIRLNGQRVVKAHQPVRVGDVLTLVALDKVMVVEIVALPLRRGPAPEARTCYRAFAGGGAGQIPPDRAA